MSEKYKVNWIKTDKGNGIFQGNLIEVECKEASHIAGGIYKNNFPVTINQVMGDKITFKTKRGFFRRNLPKGTYLLRIRGNYADHRGFGYDDKFEIV